MSDYKRTFSEDKVLLLVDENFKDKGRTFSDVNHEMFELMIESDVTIYLATNGTYSILKDRWMGCR